jgi:hypothetical protein
MVPLLVEEPSRHRHGCKTSTSIHASHIPRERAQQERCGLQCGSFALGVQPIAHYAQHQARGKRAAADLQLLDAVRPDVI